MLREEQQKAERFLDYVSMLPVDVRGNIFRAFVEAICLDLNANGYNLQRFQKDFPSLQDSVSLASAKSCFEDWVE